MGVLDKGSNTVETEDLSVDFGETGKRQQSTMSSILGARQQLPNIADTLNSDLKARTKELEEQSKALDSIIKKYEKLEKSADKETKAALKKAISINKLKKEQEDILNLQDQATILMEKGAGRAEDLLNVLVKVSNATEDTMVTCAEISTNLDSELKIRKDITDEQRRGLAITKQTAQENKDTLSRMVKEYKDTINEANKSASKSAADSIGKFTDGLAKVKGLFDLDKLVKGTERSSRMQVQEQVSRAYDLSTGIGGEFNKFKKDIMNSVDKSIYSSNEILTAMQSLQQIGIGNADEARKYYSTVLKGQSLLGMSAETQNKLYTVGNRLGRDQLTFTTNQVAKYMKTATSLDKQQLDQLVQMNANYVGDMADLGVTSEESQNTDLATGVALTNQLNDGGRLYGLVQDSVKAAASSYEQSSNMFGVDEGMFKQWVDQGKSLPEIIQNSSGKANDLYQRMLSNYDEVISNWSKYTTESGIDSSTAQVVKEMVYQQRENGVNIIDLINQRKIEGLDANKADLDKIEQEREDNTPEAKRIQNLIDNTLLKNSDWKLMEDLEFGVTTIIGILSAIQGSLNIFSNIKNIKGLSGSSKSAGESLKLLGGTSKTGKAGLATKLFGAGSKLGGTVGVSKASWGNGSLAGAAKVSGILGIATTAMDAFSGATSMSNQLYADEDGKVSGGNRFKGGLIGAFSGTKVNTTDNAYNGISGGLLKAMGAKKDTAASIKNIGGGLLSGAAKGAAIGGLIGGGPIGAGIGAVVGGIGGLIGGIVKNNDRKKQEQLQKEQLKAEQDIAKNTAQTTNAISKQNQYAQRNIQAYRMPTNGTMGATKPGYRSTPIPDWDKARIANSSEEGATMYLSKVLDNIGATFGGKLNESFGPWRVSSPYGPRDFDGFHYGIDFTNGGEIYAAHPGKVQMVTAPQYGFGSHGVVIHGDDGLTYQYAHMKAHFVNDGDHVDQGAHLGTMGMEGNATGVHLHYQVGTSKNYWEGAIDPTPYVNDSLYTGDPNATVSGSSSDDVDDSNSDTSEIKDKIKKAYQLKLDSFSQGKTYYNDDNITAGLQDIKQTLINLSDKQTAEEKLMTLLEGKKKPTPRTS